MALRRSAVSEPPGSLRPHQTRLSRQTPRDHALVFAASEKLVNVLYQSIMLSRLPADPQKKSQTGGNIREKSFLPPTVFTLHNCASGLFARQLWSVDTRQVRHFREGRGHQRHHWRGERERARGVGLATIV